MSLRLCYIPYIWAIDFSVEDFKRHLLAKGASLDDYYAVITVHDHPLSQQFLEFLANNNLDKQLIYKSTEASSYRYPTRGPRLILRVYSFKGLL
jgi:hypothetical protein